MIKVPYGPSLRSTIYYRHDLKTESSTCLMVGNQTDICEEALQQVFTSVEPPSRRRDPFTVIAAIFAEIFAIYEDERQDKDREVQAAEMQSGVCPMVTVSSHPVNGVIISPKVTVSSHPANGVIINSTKGLHFLAGRLHFLERKVDFLASCLEFLLQQHEKLTEFRSSELQGKTDELGILAVSAEKTRRSLDLSLSFATNGRQQISLLIYRILTQVKVVDNKIAQGDSQTTIAIAEQSRKIAIDTKKDSVAMKTIAALTMVFLPGTFVAVCSRPLALSGLDDADDSPKTQDHIQHGVLSGRTR